MAQSSKKTSDCAAVVGSIKQQGVFDQFRKSCGTMVESAVAIQHLSNTQDQPAFAALKRQVEANARKFLLDHRNVKAHRSELCDSLRRSISEMKFLKWGIEDVISEAVSPARIDAELIPEVARCANGHFGVNCCSVCVRNTLTSRACQHPTSGGTSSFNRSLPPQPSFRQGQGRGRVPYAQKRNTPYPYAARNVDYSRRAADGSYNRRSRWEDQSFASSSAGSYGETYPYGAGQSFGLNDCYAKPVKEEFVEEQIIVDGNVPADVIDYAEVALQQQDSNAGGASSVDFFTASTSDISLT